MNNEEVTKTTKTYTRVSLGNADETAPNTIGVSMSGGGGRFAITFKLLNSSWAAAAFFLHALISSGANGHDKIPCNNFQHDTRAAKCRRRTRGTGAITTGGKCERIRGARPSSVSVPLHEHSSRKQTLCRVGAASLMRLRVPASS